MSYENKIVKLFKILNKYKFKIFNVTMNIRILTLKMNLNRKDCNVI